jgi:LmbE family N-acetylglucosaminyl deacetylase
VRAVLDDLLAPDAGSPRSLRDIAFPASFHVLVLAPHPDDFDAIALSLRHLHGQGHELHLAVLTSGASGVEDGFEGAADAAAKTGLREQEQRQACAFFGLPADRLHFLRLWENAAQAEHDLARLAAWIAARPADLLFLPHGNDSNRTHQRTYQAVSSIAAQQGSPAWACLNQDAKTLQMRIDLYFAFDEQEAQWKARLLCCHRSQQERNLRTRGSGFDDRVLEVNRRAAAGLPTGLPYAEVFELMRIPPRAP